MKGKTIRNGRWEFLSEAGGVRIEDPRPEDVGEYNYENKDILVKTDLRGLVCAQAEPVNDIYLFKRDGNTFSPWNVWITAENGKTASAFPTPVCIPQKRTVTFLPAYAEYVCEYSFVKITTRVAIPEKGTHVFLRVTVQNKTKKPLAYSACAALKPFINNAVYNLWDAPEWYNATTVGRRGDAVEFATRLNSWQCKPAKRRMATFCADRFTSAEVRLGAFEGTGSFLCPSTLGSSPFALSVANMPVACGKTDDNTRMGYPFVYAAKGNFTLEAGESTVFSQVLSMQNKALCGEYSEEQANKAATYLLPDVQEKAYAAVQKKFAEDFSRATVQTGDEMFDAYVNAFLPLQIGWVASLDRGWPTGLRGTRDAANDFMGMLVYDPTRARKVLTDLYSFQRRDGWLPRQISTTGGAHDLRRYADSGAFLFEFLYEYLCYTGDKAVLDEQLPWLDGEGTDTLCAHMLKSFEHYLAPENIGEHGLCKIYEGDWLDAINAAGLEGRGESVMITCQLVMNLRYAAELLAWIQHPQAKELGERFLSCAEKFKNAVNAYAYNGKGFYNGTFCDSGKWLFSDCDEDGACRFYLCPNAYAVTSGVADKERTDSVFAWAEKNKRETGYPLFAPPMGNPPMHHAGRMASGDFAAGLFENGNIYNHAQAFLLRAYAAANDGDRANETLQYILPYNPEIHPSSVTKTAPYALVNCYQDLPYERGRGGMSFLTGSIAMSVRAVYNWIFGIRPTLDGLAIRPCLKRGKQDATVRFSLRGKRFTVQYAGTNTGNPPRVLFNGTETAETYTDPTNAAVPFFPVSEWRDENEIAVRFS